MNMGLAKKMRRRRFELLVFAAYLCTPRVQPLPLKELSIQAPEHPV